MLFIEKPHLLKDKPVNETAKCKTYLLAFWRGVSVISVQPKLPVYSYSYSYITRVGRQS